MAATTVEITVRQVRHFASAAVATALLSPVTAAPGGNNATGNQDLYVEVWMDRDVLAPGEEVVVRFRTATDAFVTILNVGTDGGVTILFPNDPAAANRVTAGVRRISSRGGNHSFAVDDYPGTGYLFALAAAQPVDYTRISTAGQWTHRAPAFEPLLGGNPERAMNVLATIIVPPGVAYAHDIFRYSVEDSQDSHPTLERRRPARPTPPTR